jgi:hypothetical protein
MFQIKNNHDNSQSWREEVAVATLYVSTEESADYTTYQPVQANEKSETLMMKPITRDIDGDFSTVSRLSGDILTMYDPFEDVTYIWKHAANQVMVVSVNFRYSLTEEFYHGNTAGWNLFDYADK